MQDPAIVENHDVTFLQEVLPSPFGSAQRRGEFLQRLVERWGCGRW